MKRILMTAAALLVPTLAHAQVGLPPPEYDHPFKGELVVVQAESEAEVRKLCPPQPLPIALGCAYLTLDKSRCRIIVAPPSVMAITGKYTPDIVRRHEIGHCNGWPANHPMTRSAEAPKPQVKLGAVADDIPAPKAKPTSPEIGPGAILVYRNQSWKFKGGDMSKIENWTVLTP